MAPHCTNVGVGHHSHNSTSEGTCRVAKARHEIVESGASYEVQKLIGDYIWQQSKQV